MAGASSAEHRSARRGCARSRTRRPASPVRGVMSRPQPSRRCRPTGRSRAPRRARSLPRRPPPRPERGYRAPTPRAGTRRGPRSPRATAARSRSIRRAGRSGAVGARRCGRSRRRERPNRPGADVKRRRRCPRGGAGRHRQREMGGRDGVDRRFRVHVRKRTAMECGSVGGFRVWQHTRSRGGVSRRHREIHPRQEVQWL